MTVSITRMHVWCLSLNIYVPSFSLLVTDFFENVYLYLYLQWLAYHQLHNVPIIYYCLTKCPQIQKLKTHVSFLKILGVDGQSPSAMHHELGQTSRVQEGLIHSYVRQCWLLAGHLGPPHALSPASDVDRLPWSKKAAFQEHDTQAASIFKGWAQAWNSVAFAAFCSSE